MADDMFPSEQERPSIGDAMLGLIVPQVNNIIDKLNTLTPEEAAALTENVQGTAARLSQAVDPNGDKFISSPEVTALLSNPQRVEEAMKNLPPEEREALANAITAARAGLGAACAGMSHDDIDARLNTAEASTNAGLSGMKLMAQGGGVGSIASGAVAGANGELNSITPEGINTINQVSSAVAGELPLAVDLPGAAEICPAVGGTENPALGYLKPDATPEFPGITPPSVGR